MTLSLTIEQVTMKYLFGQASMPFLTLFVAMGAWMSALNPAAAQPWPRLPDGSVVLTIQGDRVVIPPPFLAAPTMMDFHGIPTIADRPTGTLLRDILADPDRFRPLLNNDVGGVNFGAHIGGLIDGDPTAHSNSEVQRLQLWRGPLGVSTFQDRPGCDRRCQRERFCRRDWLGPDGLFYRNISNPLKQSWRDAERRIFRICAGQFLITYQTSDKWFPQDKLTDLHDQLVAFFQTMLPDTPLEVFP